MICSPPQLAKTCDKRLSSSSRISFPIFSLSCQYLDTSLLVPGQWEILRLKAVPSAQAQASQVLQGTGLGERAPNMIFNDVNSITHVLKCPGGF